MRGHRRGTWGRGGEARLGAGRPLALETSLAWLAPLIALARDHDTGATRVHEAECPCAGAANCCIRDDISSGPIIETWYLTHCMELPQNTRLIVRQIDIFYEAYTIVQSSSLKSVGRHLFHGQILIE